MDDYYTIKEESVIQLADIIRNKFGFDKVNLTYFTDRSKFNISELPSGITTIGDHAFRGCTNLALTELPNSITKIGESAFWNCNKLALTELPSSITSIGSNAFRNCTFKSITFKGTPSSISSSAFSGCTSLKTINVPWA